MIRFAFLLLATAAMVVVSSSQIQAQCYSGYGNNFRGGYNYGHYGGNRVYRPSSGISINYNTYRPSVHSYRPSVHSYRPSGYRGVNYYPRPNVYYGGNRGFYGPSNFRGYRGYGGVPYGGRGGISIGFRF